MHHKHPERRLLTEPDYKAGRKKSLHEQPERGLLTEPVRMEQEDV